MIRSRRKNPAGAWLSVKTSSAVIFSCAGTALTENEKALFHHAMPFGFILFGRNCESPDQVHALTEDLRRSVGWHCPILIDQEGGRVQRLKPPVWHQHSAMKVFGDMAAESLDQSLETLRFETLKIASELRDVGVNVNCAPVLDVLTPATHDVIGDRAFSSDASTVSRLGLSVCRQYLAASISPVIKHMPGHGRATADSHKTLPVVTASREELEQTDFRPFKEIAASDVAPATWGMVAHVIYEAIDPLHPASVSPTVISEVIRGYMGFDGLLVSDDLDMEALAAYGDIADRVEATLHAGCDVALYCHGELEKMEKISEIAPKLGVKALERLQKAVEFRKVQA